MPIGSSKTKDSQQGNRSSNRGGKDYGIQVGFYERMNKEKRVPFWTGKLSADQLERLIKDYPNGCDLYINENKEGGKESKNGKKIPHLSLSFKEPYVKGNDNGNSRGGGSRRNDDQYDDRDV